MLRLRSVEGVLGPTVVFESAPPSDQASLRAGFGESPQIHQATWIERRVSAKSGA